MKVNSGNKSITNARVGGRLGGGKAVISGGTEEGAYVGDSFVDDESGVDRAHEGEQDDAQAGGDEYHVDHRLLVHLLEKLSRKRVSGLLYFR